MGRDTIAQEALVLCNQPTMPSRAVVAVALVGCLCSLAGHSSAQFSVVQSNVTVNEVAAGATIRLQRPQNESSSRLDVTYSTVDGSAVATGMPSHPPLLYRYSLVVCDLLHC